MSDNKTLVKSCPPLIIVKETSSEALKFPVINSRIFIIYLFIYIKDF